MASYGVLAFISIHLSTLAAIICYSLTLWLEFEDSTATICHVWNLLPSFSSTIGNYTPQRYIWRSSTGVTCVLRILPIYLFNTNLVRYKKDTILRKILTFLRLAELLGLYMLTVFSSTEIFPAHAFGFCMFFLCALVNTCIVSRLMSAGVTGSGKSNNAVAWYPLIYILTFLGCFVTYLIHDNLCWPGVYTIFGVLEVIMILSNIMFWYHCDVIEWKSYTISIE